MTPDLYHTHPEDALSCPRPLTSPDDYHGAEHDELPQLRALGWILVVPVLLVVGWVAA